MGLLDCASQYFVTIGDRNGSNQERFRGKIVDVKVFGGIQPLPDSLSRYSPN